MLSPYCLVSRTPHTNSAVSAPFYTSKWAEPMVRLPCSRRGNYEMYIASVTPYTNITDTRISRDFFDFAEFVHLTAKTIRFCLSILTVVNSSKVYVFESNTLVFQHASTPVFLYSNTPVFQHAITLIFKHTSIPTCQHTSIPIFQHTSIPTC